MDAFDKEQPKSAHLVIRHPQAEFVADKVYRNHDTLTDLKEFKIRNYISGPNRVTAFGSETPPARTRTLQLETRMTVQIEIRADANRLPFNLETLSPA